MKKENRLKKRKEFAYIFKKGESVSSQSLVLVFLPSKLKKYKVGFSCSKKVGKAVVRNKVRRRLKQIVYFNRDKLQVGINYIFVAKPSSSEQTFEKLQREVEYLLGKVNSTMSK